MEIKQTSWHFKLYKFWEWRTGDKWDYNNFKARLENNIFRTDFCTYFRRAILLNLGFMVFATILYGFSAYLILNAVLYNWPFLVGALLTAGAIVTIGLIVFLIIGGIMALMDKLTNNEKSDNIFVEKVKSVKGKYCPIVEVK